MSRSSSDTPLLSIVVPAYNEKERIPDTIRHITGFMASQEYPMELLVVDDGSDDGTADVVEQLRDGQRDVRVIRNDHRGKAYTVRTGMLAARGDYVLFTDADSSTPIEEAARVVACLREGWDVVIGSREAPGAKRFNEPAFRHLMGRIFTRLVQTITGLRFEDTQCGFKAFTRIAARDVFTRVRLYGPDSPALKRAKVTGFDVELLFLAQKRGLRIRELPVRWYYAPGTKVSAVRDSFSNLLDALKVRLYDVQGRYDAGS